MTLGVHGRLTPDQARLKAKDHLGEVDHGGDPAETKEIQRHSPTVLAVSSRYMDEHARPHKKPNSIKQDELILKKYILPKIGHHPVEAITTKDIASLQHSMLSIPVQANRAISLLSKMFNLSEKWGLRPGGSNPCRHIQKYKEKPRERFLSKDELSRLGSVLAKAEKDRTERFSVITAIRLYIFTGCRKNEILNLKWNDVNLDLGIVKIADSKTGPQLIALSPPAIEILKNAPREIDNPFVCPGAKPGSHLVGVQKAWERLRTKAKIPDVRLHDLRHSFASIGAAQGMDLSMIGKLLGHKKPSTTARYAHLALDPQKAATAKIGSEINKALNNDDTIKQGGKD